MNRGIIFAFIKKEFLQIKRDISSILIAFVLPLILLFLFGFGINFDNSIIKIGVVDLDKTDISRDFIQSIKNTKYIKPHFFQTVNFANEALSGGKIRGYVVFPVNFSEEFLKGDLKADLQIVADGSEPNTAKFVNSYIQGAINSAVLHKKSQTKNNLKTRQINVIQRVWYNPSLKSVYFVLPGSLAIIMTMTGCVLGALVIAREWERGTMESILTTKISMLEFVVSKYIVYFILGFSSLCLCIFLIIFVFRVPFLGSLIALLIVSSLFMLTSIGTGLLISTLTKDQFVASQIAGTVGFMPAMMLSGLIYEIDSMPFFIRIFTYLIPAKYYVSSIISLFLSGTILKPLILNSLFMFLFSALLFYLILLNSKERIENC